VSAHPGISWFTPAWGKVAASSLTTFIEIEIGARFRRIAEQAKIGATENFICFWHLLCK
jgi:hypothetical protein